MKFLAIEEGRIVSSPAHQAGHILWTVEPSRNGYLLCNGNTVGSPSSGATARASADIQPLWEMLWDIPSLSIFTSSGVPTTRSAKSADWANNRQIALPTLTSFAPANALIKFSDNPGAAVVNLAYTISQSSVWGGNAGTYANLRDGSGSTGAATNTASSSWIEADLGQVASFVGVTVGGGELPNWGGVSLYLNGASIISSSDRQNWSTLITVSGVTNSGANQFRRFDFTQFSGRYIRLQLNGYIATTEFVIHFQ